MPRPSSSLYFIVFILHRQNPQVNVLILNLCIIADLCIFSYSGGACDHHCAWKCKSRPSGWKCSTNFRSISWCHVSRTAYSVLQRGCRYQRLCQSANRMSNLFISGPLITPSVPLHCWEGHGVNGLGGHPFADSPSRQSEKEIAALALIDIINANPGAYTLRMTMFWFVIIMIGSDQSISVVFLGPMTNLALAVRLDPSIATKVKKLVFMGGTSQGKGNITPCAEFNVFADPEAAQIVLESFRVFSLPLSSLLPSTCML